MMIVLIDYLIYWNKEKASTKDVGKIIVDAFLLHKQGFVQLMLGHFYILKTRLLPVRILFCSRIMQLTICMPKQVSFKNL